jgi:hypothetical protein
LHAYLLSIPQITIFIGGMIPIPRKMGGLWLCFTHINLCHNMEISLMIIIYICFNDDHIFNDHI